MIEMEQRHGFHLGQFLFERWPETFAGVVWPGASAVVDESA